MPLNDVGSEQWFALHVRSNYERLVQCTLHGKGYQEFLPLWRKRVRRADRFEEIEVPLFPGYVFGRFDVTRRLPVLTIPGVVRVVSGGCGPEPIDETELERIQRFVASGLPIGPWPFLHIGDRVVVESGALAGLEGLLVETRNQCRVVVSLGLLQRSVAVEIDRACVRPISCQRVAASAC